MNKIVVRPRGFARVRNLAWSSVFLMVYGGPIVGLSLLLPGPWWVWPELFVGVWGVIASLRAVRRLELSDRGIHFRRYLGRPKFVSWDRVKQIRPAPASEVVFRGWILAPFGGRANTSAVGSYRIDWEEGHLFFAPEEEITFVDSAKVFLADRPGKHALYAHEVRQEHA